jgi:hypothetical protein
MTMHATTEIIWCIGAVLATLALDFLSRRFHGGRLRRGGITEEPRDRAAETSDPQPDVSPSIQQTRTRIYSAIHQKEDVDV